MKNENNVTNDRFKTEFGDKIKVRNTYWPKMKIISVPEYFHTDIKENIVPFII